MVRRLIGADRILGVSAQTVEQALLAESQGADYLGVGSVFPTSTKLDADAVSFETLRDICSAVRIPVVAIGGITRDNIDRLSGSGIAGIARCLSHICQADIERATPGTARFHGAGRLMTIRGAIFDLDGTLLDSMGIWDTLASAYLRTIGITPRPNVRLCSPCAQYGRGGAIFDSGIWSLADCAGSRAGGQRSDRGLLRERVLLKPGTAALLAAFARSGVKICAATSGNRELASAALARCGVLSYFQRIWTCSEIGYGKDSPAIYEAACACLGTPVHETAVFEDALYALRTAKAAGFFTVAVADPSAADDREALKNAADIYLEALTDWENIHG